MSEISKWMQTNGLEKYVEVFLDNEVEFADLTQLNQDDLREMGIPLGPRKRLLRLIGELAQSNDNPSEVTTITGDAERRQLTVMFCDLVDSTALSTKFDLEEYREIIGSYQELIAGIVAKYGGFIARYFGDGVLVYFGYPQASENDAESAILASLAATASIHEVSPLPGRDLGLKLRIGISTGIVVAGDLIGKGSSEERSVLGETPNLAARLQSLAKPNSVVVSNATRELVVSKFDWLDLEKHSLKGFDDPIQAWQLVGARDNSESMGSTHNSPLFGRQKELDILIDQWNQGLAGKGRTVLIKAEPGVGKSRLVHELTQKISDDDPQVVLFPGSPYHSNSALQPVIEYLNRILGVGQAGASDEYLKNLEQYVDQLGMDKQHAVPLFCSILGTDLGNHQRYPSVELTPSEVRRRTLAVLVEFFENFATQSPVLMVVEDLHWIDPTTIEFLGELLERMESTRILALFTFRPEFDSPWSPNPTMTTLSLEALSEQDCREMIISLSGNNALSDKLTSKLIDRTDGVPLYLEELSRNLLELNTDSSTDTVIDEADIPATLRDALMARLDKLNFVKETAQLASIIGRTFSIDLLSAVSPLNSAKLASSLSTLIDAKIVVRAKEDGNFYEFRHALIRDAAYDTLLRHRRRELHRQVATAIRDSERDAARPELLAYHYSESHDFDLAADYWLSAGQAALMRSANLEAIGHLDRGIDQLEFIDLEDREQRELALRATLGPALAATTGFASEEVGDQYSRARELCQKFRGAPQLFPAIAGSWIYSLVRGELESSKNLAKEMLSLGTTTGDSSMLVEAHWAMGNSSYWLAELEPALQHLQKAYEIYDPESHFANALIYGQDPGVASQCYLSYTQWQLGFPDKAVEALDLAREMAENRNHAFTRGWALAFRFLVYMFRGEPIAAQNAAEESLNFSAAQSYPFWVAAATVVRGWARAQLGATKEGIEEMRQGIEMHQTIGCGLVQPLWHALLAETFISTGDYDLAQSELDLGFASAAQNKEVISEIDLWRLKGELVLQRDAGETDVAQKLFERAIEIARSAGARSLELRAASSMHRLLTLRGLDSENSALAELYNTFDEGLETADLEIARKLLSENN